MADNRNQSKKKKARAAEKAAESRWQDTDRSGWNRIIRVRPDKTAVVRPAIAYPVVIGALALAILIAWIVIF